MRSGASGCVRPRPGSRIRSPGGRRRPLERLRQVPHDLGEVYDLVYAFIRKGGKLPDCARWIEGHVRA
jgi:hypothetical protein